MDSEASTKVLIQEVNKISVITQSLADALILLREKGNLLLRDKRITLEDKAIIEIFLELIIVFAKTSQNLCRLYEYSQTRFDHSTNNDNEETLSELIGLNSSIQLLVEGCLKALSHGYNYFEQYYEYDFVAKLRGLDLGAQLLDLNSRIAGRYPL